ncbi:MAG: type 4a pilus biogenesis protein PilO [Kofleriaceae bacterium]|nr:type 4a pilus biogenesis protein PilO [Myxococcales bacterium]MCB9561353.1 type 4a pilus biogenesis protein PilO [Kofleriaceae bacterium]MCB9574221.1 type 4a pilus biogenesis protein PilO [Kofleriaceae bacterium]
MATQAGGAAGAIAEFGRRPTGFKVLVFVAIGAALGLGYYTLVFKGLHKERKEAEVQNADLISQGRQLKKDEAEHARLKEQQEQLKKIIEQNNDALPTAAQLPAFFDLLNRKFGEAGVDVKSWTQQKEIAVQEGEGANVETYYKVPVQIEIQGTFLEIKRFFYLLYKMSQKEGQAGFTDVDGTTSSAEDQDRILTIEELVLGSPEVRNNELLLTATFRASTFRQDTPASDAAAAAAVTGAKPAPKPAPKNPVQKAKQKTEDAMDKSEQRVEKATDRAEGPPGGSGSGSGSGSDRVKGGL